MKKSFVFSLLSILRFFRNILTTSETTYKFLFLPHLEKLRWQIGLWKAWKVFAYAQKKVPAYKEFLIDNGSSPTIKTKFLTPDLSVIPITDKEAYVKKYSIESRCINGTLGSKGVMIDESSGTSGTANNWVRGTSERRAIKKILQISLHYQYGKDRVFIINAFALGPWATGMNVSMSLVDISILKSTGPDIKKIENTLNFFGSSYNYIIMGYPPFIKSLLDHAQVDWEKYNITGIFGGEGISEGMRSYLLQYFKKVYGSYGASDLEINIGAENDGTIALRRLLINNKDIYNSLIPDQFRHLGTPMIFQYNPLDYYIETNNEGELIITLCRLSNLSPKIRYNIHDSGFVTRIPDLKKKITKDLLPQFDIELPLLFHFGRSDMAVAFYGCKITPKDIEEAIFSIPELASVINSFSLITHEDEQQNKHLDLALELAEGKDSLQIALTEAKDIVFAKLKEINQDFREVEPTVPDSLKPTISIYNYQEGPFTINDIRLKKHYIQESVN